jgi:bifunctional UDP-N-acetylglucosamine pyrophosphorylase/glucosamine-1-phosphate N-acetyltransferase
MTQVIILAAGKGKRMGAALPKVLCEVGGKPMVERLVDSILQSGVTKRPLVVIGYGTEIIKKYLGTRCSYVLQAEQLGTAHAVLCAKDFLTDVENIIVVNGDTPFLRPETLVKLAAAHEEKQAALTLATLRLPDFNDWREIFYDFGRIMRDESEKISAIVEKKDATPEQLKISEVNPSFFCFKSNWLWENLAKINCENAQGEFYLTDLVKLAILENCKVETLVTDDPTEAVGINTPEQLGLAQSLSQKSL